MKELDRHHDQKFRICDSSYTASQGWGRSLQSMTRFTHKQNTEQSVILESYIVNSLTYQQIYLRL